MAHRQAAGFQHRVWRGQLRPISFALLKHVTAPPPSSTPPPPAILHLGDMAEDTATDKPTGRSHLARTSCASPASAVAIQRSRHLSLLSLRDVCPAVTDTMSAGRSSCAAVQWGPADAETQRRSRRRGCGDCESATRRFLTRPLPPLHPSLHPSSLHPAASPLLSHSPQTASGWHSAKVRRPRACVPVEKRECVDE